MTDVLFLFFTDGSAYHHGLALLSGALEADGVSTGLHVVDLRKDEATQDAELTAALEEKSPRIIAVSAMGCHWPAISRILDARRGSLSAPVLVGGWHATLSPEDILNHDGVDFVCVGEGDEAMPELVRALLAGGDGSDIPNIWRMRNGSIIRTPIRPPVADLDVLPSPNRALFPFSEAISANTMGILGPVGPPRLAPMMTGRGCVHDCSYCCNASWRDRYGLPAKAFVRRRSVPRVLEEIADVIEKYDPSWFEFWDEDFSFGGEWLREFCEECPKVSSIPFCILARPNNVQGDEFEILAKAGCGLVMMGIESGDDTFRREVLQRRMSNEQIVNAFDLARKNGIATVGLCMMGMPFETAENVRATIDICERTRPDFHLWFVYVPFPGSRLYRKAEEAGLLRPDSALNYRNTAANVNGIPDDVFMELRNRMEALQGELDHEREARFPRRFGPVAQSLEIDRHERGVKGKIRYCLRRMKHMIRG